MHPHDPPPFTSPAAKLASDLIDVRSFPAVVQASDIRKLRTAADSAGADDFVSGYLGFDERSQRALHATVHALAHDASGVGQGGAFFLNGVFGSGKSHLLGLLALLADGIGHAAFSIAHPQLSPALETFVPRLVVHFSLDDYDAARFSLEDVFWREVHGEWSRRGLPPLVLPERGSRAEACASLEEALLAQGMQGLVVCLDEVSLFLSAKEHRALQGDAAFLQFLGQRARRQHGGGDRPLWVFAALQKTFEDIGELEAYSVAQIRDRFTTLPLSLAHLPSLIAHRLVVRKDNAALQRICHDSFETLSRALPRLDFGIREWDELYPFHPATVTLLEQVVARFFSRTRSAVLFCANALERSRREAQPAAARIAPGALFAYVEPELEGHPDLRPLTAVWSTWRESVATLAPDEQDATVLRQLMEALLLFKIAGSAPSVVQLANAIALDARLPGDGNYDYARALLEKLRTRGSYLAVERNEGAYADRYTIDLGTRVGEMARRFTLNTLQSIPVGDGRIAQYATACCQDETLPLAALTHGTGGNTAFPVMWRNAPRRFAVALWSELLTAPVLANRVAALAQPGNPEDALLVLVPPFAGQESTACASASEALQSLALDTQSRRWQSALLLWTPRAPTGDEWTLAREATAQHLLERDPQLLDNRRGRAILQYLKAEAPQREAALRRVAARLLREGQVSAGVDAVLEAGELPGDSSWTSTLEALAEFSLGQVFPRFDTVAPRMRVLTASNADALCLEILRRPAATPYFAPSLERAARAIAEPLGIARAEQGRWSIEPPRADLAAALKALVEPGGTAMTIVAALFAKSEWGLVPEQTAVAVCALLRSGDLLAVDARGVVLPPAQIGMPLRRAVRAIQPGELLDGAAWSRVQALLAALGLPAPGAVSFAHQEQARAALVQWRETAVAETELAQARLHQLRRQLGHAAAQWTATETAWDQVIQCLSAIGDSGGSVELLRRAAAIDLETLRPALTTWRRVVDGLESKHAALLGAHALLMNPALATPPDLHEQRTALQMHFGDGESLLEGSEFLHDAEVWRAAYAGHYRDWHATQHDAARWAPYRRLASADAVRVLERVATIGTRSLPAGAAVRAMLDEELEKGCGHDGTLPGHEVVCPACQLRWGERLRLRDPVEIETAIAQGLTSFHNTLLEPPIERYLSRHAAGAELLAWTQAPDADALLPLLSDEALHALSEAFRPRRSVTRSWPELRQRFLTCRTSADLHQAFRSWLDNNEALDDEDEVGVDFGE